MMFGLRKLTSGCALAAAMGLMNPVMAGPVTLDFEGLPLSQPVGSAYTGVGIMFSGDNTVKDDTLFSPSPIPPSVRFISSGTSFIVDVVDPNATPFNALNFDYVGALDVSIFDTAGGMTSVKIDLSISPDWQMLGDPILLDKSTRIDRVEFVRSGTTSFGLMGIDNLSFYLQPGSITPPPNPVPEPAGFALVALALLGVGLMSRRRG